MQNNLEQQAALYTKIMEGAQAQINKLLASGVEAGSNVIATLQKDYNSAAESLRKTTQKIADNILSIYDDFMTKADSFDWWDEIGTTKLDYLYEKLDAINEQYQKGYYTVQRYNELVSEVQKGIYDEQKDALQEILDMVEKIVRQESQDKIDALEKQKDAYRDIINTKKQMLRIAEKELSYNRSVEEKATEIGKLQTRIDLLDLDDSREAKAERAALLEELAKLQAELAEYQSDHSLELQENALDKEYDNFESNIDKEIDVVQAGLANAADIHQQVIEYINANWETLYDNLNEYDIAHGSGIVDNIKGAWDTALESLTAYKNALGSMTVEEAAKTGIGMGSKQPDFSDISSGTAQKNIVKQMYDNSQSARNYFTAHGSDNSLWQADNYLKSLNQTNYQLKDELEKLTGKSVVFDSKTGKWYMDGKELFTQFGFYHSGGVVGKKSGDIKENEMLSLLEKGEVVLTKEQQSRAVTLMKKGIELLPDNDPVVARNRILQESPVALRPDAQSSFFAQKYQEQAQQLVDIQKAPITQYLNQTRSVGEVSVKLDQTYHIEALDLKGHKKLVNQIGEETCKTIMKGLKAFNSKACPIPLRPN